MAGGGQLGDTTYTKVFVGGLAWETQKETMKQYFEHFGEILEAVVITDRTTGRSKGYGFVTFREAEAAMRACVDATPVIDGRRANCNLASLGVQRSKPSTPKHGGGGRKMRVMNTMQSGFGSSFASPPAFPHYALPFNLFGYSPYSPDYSYPTSFYSVYGGGPGGSGGEYTMYGGSGVMTTTAAASHFYPCGLTFAGETNVGGSNTAYFPHPHHHLFPFSPYNPPHYPPPAFPSGVTLAGQPLPIPHR